MNNRTGYFCHDINASIISRTLTTMQSQYGNDGYACWFKILEMLGAKGGQALNLSQKADWNYFVARIGCSEERVEWMLQTLCEMNAIDAERYEKFKEIYCENFYQRMSICSECKGKKIPKMDAGIKEVENEFGNRKKFAYGEFVRLTEAEYDALGQRIGDEAREEAIEILNNYKGSSGRNYKSDYRAILNWVIDRIKQKNPNMIKPKTVDMGENPFEEWAR